MSRGDAAAAAWIFRGKQVAATPRLRRGYFVETSRGSQVAVLAMDDALATALLAMSLERLDAVTDPAAVAVRAEAEALLKFARDRRRAAGATGKA